MTRPVAWAESRVLQTRTLCSCLYLFSSIVQNEDKIQNVPRTMAREVKLMKISQSIVCKHA